MHLVYKNFMPSKLEKPFTLAIDIGGTHIKMLVLDKNARYVGKRLVLDTPKPATPRAIFALIAKMIEQLSRYDRISVGFPGVVRNGVVETAPNLDQSWPKTKLQAQITRILGKPCRTANDADVQGLGVIKGKGVEMMLTLGTGMGAALFVDGKLVPNVEMWHHPFRKDKSYEDLLGMKGLKHYGKKKWNKSLKRAIEILSRTFNYDNLYIGGGHTHLINFELPRNAKITSNVAGLWGGVALWG
jgi:polyphosphate glucokinase